MLIVAIEGDVYQTIQVEETLTAKGMDTTNSRVLYPISVRELNFLQYRSFEPNRMVFIHTQQRQHIQAVFNGDLDYWHVVLYVEKFSDVTSYIPSGLDITQYKRVQSWQEKYDFFKQRLDGHRFDKGVKDLLVKLLIRKPTEYESVRSYLAIVEDEQITIDDIQYLFWDSDMYRLDDFLFNLTYGLSKRKTEWMLDYFIHVREYHPRWLYQKLVEFIEDVSYIYALKRRGVIKHALIYTDYQKRASAAGLTPKENFISYGMQLKLFEQMEVITKREFMERARQIMKTGATTEDELYAILVGGTVWRESKSHSNNR